MAKNAFFANILRFFGQKNCQSFYNRVRYCHVANGCYFCIEISTSCGKKMPVGVRTNAYGAATWRI